MYGHSSITGFARKLATAQGYRVNFDRGIQCEFQVPLTELKGDDNTLMGGACYCYPRAPGDSIGIKSQMYYPFCQPDTLGIATHMLNQGSTGTDAYNSFLQATYKAHYTIRNQNSFPTRFEVMRFRSKRNLPFVSNISTSINGYQNLFNVAGNYLKRTGQSTGTGAGDATNTSLYLIPTRAELIPPVKWAFSCKKKMIKLEPGEQRSFSVSGRRSFTKVELFGMEIETQSIANVRYDHWARSTFVCFKMYSEPADYNDATTNALNAESTRTTPVCLLTYRCRYNVLAPQYLPTISHFNLGVLGVVAEPVAANIANMGDDDEKDIVQSNAL